MPKKQIPGRKFNFVYRESCIVHRSTNHDSRSEKKGFSVLEMIFVLVLVVIILGISLIRMRGMSEHKNIETAKGDLRAIQTAINAYYLNHSSAYPAGSDWQSNDLVNDSPRVLRQILYDPFRTGNSEYSYSVSGNGKYYVAFSYGSDSAADITGIDNNGKLTGQNDDDIFITNGTGTFSS